MASTTRRSSRNGRRHLAALAGQYLGVPDGRLAFDSWDDAVHAITNIRRGKGPVLVVIDEFPYLLPQSPELPSLLQRRIDASRDGEPGIRLILCGSALSVMAKLLVGTQALRGRASHDLVLGTFDYRSAGMILGRRRRRGGVPHPCSAGRHTRLPRPHFGRDPGADDELQRLARAWRSQPG